MGPSLQGGNDVVERCRLLCDEAKQLCSELRETLAKTQQLRWQLRELSNAGNLAVGQLARKATILSGTHGQAGMLVS